MTLLGKGTTKIGIGDDSYLYKESETQIVIEKDGVAHPQSLICTFPQKDYYNIKSVEFSGEIIKIDIHRVGFPQPKLFVREMIFSAISLGWQPKMSGGSFRIRLADLGPLEIYEFRVQ